MATGNPMELFDSIATNGAVRPKEFATIIQMSATLTLKQPVDPGLQAATAFLQEQLGSDEDTPAMQELRKKMKPIVNRAIDRLDTAHMKTLLEMLFRVMDANSNGTIEKAEFESFFNSIFGPGGPNPAAISDILFKMIDKNGNGKLSVEEVQSLIDAIAEIICTVISGIADIGEVVIGSSDTTKVTLDLLKEVAKQAGVEEDLTNILPRDEVTKRLEESGGFDAIEEMMKGLDENKTQIMGVFKAMRESIGKFESSVGAKFYMKAMEFSKGGVNEANFVAQVVPLIREYQKEEMAKFEENPSKQINDSMKVLAAIGGPNQGEVEGSMKAMLEDKGMVAALKKANERASEYIPEMVRSVFRFLDLDGSGTITTKEIKLLKALLDALLHLGERAVTELSEEEMKSIEGTTKENAKTLALTIYDIVDRDGNGKLSLVEFVQFMQKVVVFWLGMVKFLAHTVIECQIDEIAKCKLEQDWKAKNKTEVEKDEFMQMMMMAPMMFAMMMPR